MEALRWLIPLLVLVVMFVVGGRAILSMSSRRSEEPLICTTCGAQTDMPQSKSSGSFVIEILLWLAFVIPGLLYSLWRQSTRRKVCPACGSATLIVANTPDGRKLAARFSGGKS
jgi:DNA-directed RNA polymerase subunit RPC12/RpoP